MEPGRLEELRIVRRLRDGVRRLFRLELSFTDARGEVLDHQKGLIIPPGNGICDACLGDKAGLSLCNESIRKAVARLDGAGGKARLLGPCHMGLDIVAAPVRVDGELRGSVFGCGFLIDERAEAARAPALAQTAALRLQVGNAPAAFDQIARVGGRDASRVTELVDVIAEEIAAHETPSRRRSTPPPARSAFGDLVGSSEPMLRLYALLDKVAVSDVTVLINGENGTGKELIARALHAFGRRRMRPFVAQNCSALNDNLLESELFGHVKGAFTGAARDKVGLFKVADGGTLFLDEVGDMSPAMQVKMLRVLQESTFLPVGSTRPEKVDVRVIAATNRNLREMVARREFREDLFYRLHVVVIENPPLRQRLDDLPVLVEHFLARHARRAGTQPKRLHPDLLARFYEHDWPGNVRELEHELERLVVLAGEAEEIPAELAQPRVTGPAPVERRLAAIAQQGRSQDLATAVARLEKELIEAALRELRYNRSKAAEKLGVSRTTLIKKIREYGIGEDPG